jgi:hypothetical protein
LPLEVEVVGGRCGVAAIGGEDPSDLVRSFWAQHDGLQGAPEVEELWQQLWRKIPTHIMDPSVVVERHGDGLVLSS